jgi:hypothetical protein
VQLRAIRTPLAGIADRLPDIDRWILAGPSSANSPPS